MCARRAALPLGGGASYPPPVRRPLPRCLASVVVSIVLVSAAVLAPRVGFAETEGEALFRRGVEAFEKQDYAAACPLFEQSFDSGHAASARYMLGQCEEKQGHLVVARTHYDWVAHDDKAKKDVRDHATENIASLDARIARLVLDLGATPPAGASVEVDGVKIEDVGGPILVDPGTHDVVATAPGRAPKTQKVTAADGASVPVKVEFGELRKDSTTPEEPSVVHPLRVPGWILFGVGAAGLVGAGVTGGVILSECAGLSHCPSTASAEGPVKTDGHVKLEIANGVLWAVGGAIAATGLSLVIADVVTGGTTREKASVSLRLHPAGLDLVGQF